MKSLIILLTLLSLTVSSYAQDITGSWSGKASIGGNELRLVFNLEASEDGLTGTMDSPDQGAKGIPLTSALLEGDRLTLVITNLGFKYEGSFDGKEIKGSFSQSGASFPLDLTKGEIVVQRPQEPKPPFPYRSEEVKFENTAAGVTLAGTLTIPQGGGKYPVAIMVTGSGPQNRDEEILGHKPFLVISDYLTRNGIAVLRYDDRGTAESTGSFAGSTSEDFTWDALAAFDFLKTHADIDHSKIGMIGHSEGGTIGFMMASRQPELAFVVSMAGSIIPGDSTLILQNRDIMVSQGFDGELAEKYCRSVSSVYKIRKSDATVVVYDREEIKSRIAGYNDLPETFQDNLIAVLNMSDPWFDFFIKFDPAEDISRTACPVFAINGDKDLQVKAENNLQRLSGILDRTGNKKYATRIYPGLNHLFQQCETGALEEYGRIEQTISPQVLEDIAGWILEVTKQ